MPRATELLSDGRACTQVVLLQSPTPSPSFHHADPSPQALLARAPPGVAQEAWKVSVPSTLSPEEMENRAGGAAVPPQSH